jgi:hypothetical protein
MCVARVFWHVTDMGIALCCPCSFYCCKGHAGGLTAQCCSVLRSLLMLSLLLFLMLQQFRDELSCRLRQGHTPTGETACLPKGHTTAGKHVTKSHYLNTGC